MEFRGLRKQAGRYRRDLVVVQISGHDISKTYLFIQAANNFSSAVVLSKKPSGTELI